MYKALSTVVLTMLLVSIWASAFDVKLSGAPKQLDGSGGALCWVNLFDNTETTGWTFTGNSPYLHNDSNSYIASLTTGNCAWFHFQDTGLATLQTVFLMIEWKTSRITGGEAKLCLDNGVSQTDLGPFNLTLEYRWTRINITSVLKTVLMVNDAKLRITSLRSVLYLVNVRRAYLRVCNGPVPTQTGGAVYGKPGSKVTLSLKWADPDGLSSYALNHNASGSWLAENLTGSLTGEEAWSNQTVTLPNDTASVLAYRFWANDTENNWEKSEFFYVYPVKNFNLDLLQYIGEVSSSPISHSYGRKDFYDIMTGRFWEFYSDGTNMKYTSTSDGHVWSPSQVVRATEGGYTFYVHASMGVVHYVFNSEKTGDDVCYRKGTLNSDGTIAWVAPEQVAVDAGTSQKLYVCSVVSDNSGYPYIVFGNRTNQNAKTLSLVKSDYNNGVWHTASGFPKQINENPDVDLVSGVALDLPDNKIYVVYCSAGSEEPPRGRLWQGSTLGPLENASNYMMTSNYPFSAVSDRFGNVHIAYRRASNRIDYSFRNFTIGIWQVKDELVTYYVTNETLGSAIFSWPVIGCTRARTDPDLEEVYVHWWTLEDKSAWLEIRSATGWEPRKRIIRLNNDYTLIDGDVIVAQAGQNMILLNFVTQNVISGLKYLWAYAYTNRRPVAFFSESAEIVYTGETIVFDASESYDTDGIITKFFWSFGDGINMTGEIVEHAYADDGSYTVSLMVTDDDGGTGSAYADKVVLNRPPVAVFTESAETVYPTEPIILNATESYDPDGLIVLYRWDFGDDTSATGTVVEHAYSAEGVYTVTLTVTDDDGATDNATSTKIVLRRDVAVLAVVPSRTLVGRGFTVSISVTVENQGDYTETFNITVYAGTKMIQEQAVLLTSGNSTTVTLQWNTTGWTYSNYTISAAADRVPGETDTADNTLVDGWVFLTIPGDVDKDKDVDIFDIVLISNSYYTKKPNPKYNPDCDWDNDGDVDIYDLVIATMNYGKNW